MTHVRRARAGALAVILAAMSCPALLPAQGAAAPTAEYAAAIAAARRLITDTMAAIRAPGAAITIIRDGRVVWSEGFGYADLEQHVRATPATRFRIASVSKAITGVAVGWLVQNGKLDLDAPVQRYVPTFPAKRWPVTTRQLAGHLAGIRHYRGNEFWSSRHYASIQEGLSIFQDDSLLFEPGSRVSYSSYGFNLISAVVEGASGEPFVRFMTEHVFAPAGMSHTGLDYVDSLVPDRARNYVHDSVSGTLLNAPFVDNSYKPAGGGFLSSSEDLARFGWALLDGKLLAPETTRLLWTPQKTNDGKPTGYGIGWGIARDSAGRLWVGHTGGGIGATANLRIYPEQRVVVAILVNSDQTFIGALPRIAEGFLTAAP